MLRVKKLSVHYGPFRALVGPNKAGKTTLLLTLSGILETTEGRVFFHEEDITNLDPYKIVAKGLGHVPQGRHIFPTISVFDNLMMGAYIRRKAREAIQVDLTWIYELFPVLKKRGSQRAGTLSGGEQQMLAIGRALMGNPKLLMLDEPSSGLAPRYIDEIFAAFQEINKRGLTLFIVEQEIQRSLAIAHRGYVLRNGRLTRGGASSALLESREVQELCLG
jgi:branched-chain amino acid transport system ATP-binding protein